MKTNKFKKKSSPEFVMILIIMFVNFRNSQAQNLNNYINDLIQNPRPDDNVIVGNNIRDRVQENGKTTIHADGREYVHYWNNRENPNNEVPNGRRNQIGPNINAGHDNRQNVQINGDTNIGYANRNPVANEPNRDMPHGSGQHVHNLHVSAGPDYRESNARYPKGNHNIISGNNLHNRVQLNRDTNIYYENTNLPQQNIPNRPTMENPNRDISGYNRNHLPVNNRNQNGYIERLTNHPTIDNPAYNNDGQPVRPSSSGNNFLSINKNGNGVQVQVDLDQNIHPNNRNSYNNGHSNYHNSRVQDKGYRDQLYTSNGDNIISGNNIRNRMQINGQTIDEGKNGDNEPKRSNVGFEKHNIGHNHKAKSEGKIKKDHRDKLCSNSDVEGKVIKEHQDKLCDNNGHNIIAGDNIKNRVQLNGKTIEEGTTDDVQDQKKPGKKPKEITVSTTEAPSSWQSFKNFFG